MADRMSAKTLSEAFQHRALYEFSHALQEKITQPHANALWHTGLITPKQH